MARERAKTITLLASLAAVAVTVLVGLSWRQIYYGIYPEARFWGQWKVVVSNEIPPITVTKIEFPPDGGGRVDVRKTPSGFSSMSDWHMESLVVPNHVYRVTRSRVNFPDLSDVPHTENVVFGTRIEIRVNQAQTVTLRYRFQTEDLLIIENIVGDERSLTLHRLADSVDTDE